jgi:hypothetical protein
VSSGSKPEQRRLKRAAAHALANAADGELDGGYVSEWKKNLLPGLSPENQALLELEFGAGKGGELAGARPKFCAAYSSSALAANTFARWRNDPADLRHLQIADSRGFETLALEHPCPSGLRGVPPHLDALAIADERVVAVESKCLEPLSNHRAAFRDVYRKRVETIGHPSWLARFEELVRTPDSYRLLDAAQLVKHYLGLKNTFGDRQRMTLAYLWWEPANTDRLPLLEQHREEVRRFARDLNDPQVAFHSQAYPDLWAAWANQGEPPWLREHVERLRRRYLVDIPL